MAAGCDDANSVGRRQSPGTGRALGSAGRLIGPVVTDPAIRREKGVALLQIQAEGVPEDQHGLTPSAFVAGTAATVRTGDSGYSHAAPSTPAESPSALRRIGVRSVSLKITRATASRPSV